MAVIRYSGILSALLAAILLSSCSPRMEQREVRYDAKQCPFCSLDKGVCSYCNGSAKCTLCDGTGKRLTATPAIEEEGLNQASYTETCPYCKGAGVCRYCNGNKKCAACEGSGNAGDWNFYKRFSERLPASTIK